MNVLFLFGHDLVLGGHFKSARAFASSLLSRGHKIFVMAPGGSPETIEPLIKAGCVFNGIKNTNGDLLKISGGAGFKGTDVNALDLRAGIALLLAGLTAEGTTTIHNAWQIKRGYENLDQKLKSLGVNSFNMMGG